MILKDVVNVAKKMFVSTGKKDNFEKGKSLCAKAGGVLASPRNEAENTALKDLVSPSTQAYIGVSDAQTEGRFMYVSGGPLTYSNWKPGEPNNMKNEDCAVIEGSGKWNDLDCSNSNIFIICELWTANKQKKINPTFFSQLCGFVEVCYYIAE